MQALARHARKCCVVRATNGNCNELRASTTHLLQGSNVESINAGGHRMEDAAAGGGNGGRKVVTFLRHGVAAHNFHDAKDPDPDEPERYTDSPLTE